MPDANTDRLLDPSYIEGLRDLSLEEVRSKRSECQEVEVGLSYERRLVQGRLDIVLADVQRRAGGGPADLASLVENLDEILADKGNRPGFGRLPTLMAPSDASEYEMEVDTVAPANRLSSLPELSDEEVHALTDALAELERRVSDRRRKVLDRIDKLQEEIVRRYKEGEANVDSLLR